LLESLNFLIGDRDEQNAPKGGCGIIKNNTIAFNWERLGHDYNIYQGRQTQLTVKDNILAFAGCGIGNMFDNRFGRYIGNVFFGHTTGSYKYYDPNGTKSILILDDLTQMDGDKCKKQYQCSKQSKSNVSVDPKFKKVDNFFLYKFFNQIASVGGGKVSMDSMNQWRSTLGIPLQGAAGSGVQNYAPIWDPGADFASVLLFSEAAAGKGAQLNGIGGKFQEYKSLSVDAASKTYTEVAYEDIKRAQKMVDPIIKTGDKGMDIQVKIKIKDQDMSGYYLPAASGVLRDKGWLSYRDETYEIWVYVMKGSPAHEMVLQSKKEGTPILIKGTAYGASKDKVGIKVDAAESLDSD